MTADTDQDPIGDALSLDHPSLSGVYEQADRVVQVVRAIATVVFALVLLVNGPVLGVDPPSFTLPGLGMTALGLASALAALGVTRMFGHRAWLSWFTIVVDVTIVSFLGILLGGARSIVPVLLLVVITLNGLRLRAHQLVFTVLLATAAYLAMAALGTAPERADRQVVFLATIWVMGVATLGTIFMGRHLARQALARQRDRLALQRNVERYFSPQVSRLLLHEPARLRSQRRMVTALFADLTGFTRLSETAPGEVVIDTLDAYLGALAGVAIANDGTVDNYLGDALLVVFNAPADQPDHAERALRTAREMQEAARALSERRLAEGRAALSLVIGVNSGLATVGNIGGAERLQYTVIGDAVNVASRLESLGMPGDVIVGESTVRFIGLGTRSLESQFVRGRAAPVRFVRITTGVRPAPDPDEQTELGAGARVAGDEAPLPFDLRGERVTEQVGPAERDSGELPGAAEAEEEPTELQR